MREVRMKHFRFHKKIINKFLFKKILKFNIEIKIRYDKLREIGH